VAEIALINFFHSIRGQLIISQALFYGINHLKKLEKREIPYPENGEHAEPSNREDMEDLQVLFPMYSDIQEVLKDGDQGTD
jgi:hypothetical protein